MTIGLPHSSGKKEEAQGRAAHVLWLLATNNQGAPVRTIAYYGHSGTVNTRASSLSALIAIVTLAPIACDCL